MNYSLLVALAALELAIVLLLFGFLIWNRVSRGLWTRRRERAVERLGLALDLWRAGRVREEELSFLLEKTPLRAVREVLEGQPSRPTKRSGAEVTRAILGSAFLSRVRGAAGSRFWWRRMEAAQLLGLVGGGEDAAILEDLMSDRHPLVELAAVFAARRLTLPELLEPLMEKALGVDSTRKEHVVEALLAYGRRLVPVLSERLQRPGGGVERSILLMLAARSRAPELTRFVMTHTLDPDLEPRIQAVRALACLPASDGEAEAALLAALRDPAWEVRAQAASGLGALRAGEAIGELRRSLSDRHWWVRLRAALALRQLGDTGTRVLERVEPGSDPYAYDMAQYVLRLEDVAVSQYVP